MNPGGNSPLGPIPSGSNLPSMPIHPQTTQPSVPVGNSPIYPGTSIPANGKSHHGAGKSMGAEMRKIRQAQKAISSSTGMSQRTKQEEMKNLNTALRDVKAGKGASKNVQNLVKKTLKK